MSKTIFDEINILDNPYEILGIPEDSNNETVKEAYKLIRQSLPPENREKVEEAYSLVKTKILRERFKILKNKPLNSIDEIKNYGIRPQELDTNKWMNLIIKGQSEA